MPEILFLVGDVAHARNDNHQRLPEGFRAAGWQTTTVPHDAVRLNRGRVELGPHDPERFRLIWLLGFGRWATFLDRMQLLRLLNQDRFVTGVDPLIQLHGKTAWSAHLPETYAANDLAFLLSVLETGGDWVIKPTAGSFGRDVRRITNDEAGRAALANFVGHEPGSYCLLQRYLPAAANGEKRTLVVGGRIIGSYRRRPETDFRANLAAGASAEPTVLSDEESGLVQQLASHLAASGVGFAAVDTVFPQLMEVNIVNPGGLATLQSLYGRDFTPAVVDAIVETRG